MSAEGNSPTIDPRDVDTLLGRFRKESNIRGFSFEIPGEVEEDSIVLVRAAPTNSGRKLLVAAGFHAPGLFSDHLRLAQNVFFDSMPDGLIEGVLAKAGLVFKQSDGSFEDRLFREGVPRTACTETPGKAKFCGSVEANQAIAGAFVDFHLEM